MRDAAAACSPYFVKRIEEFAATASVSIATVDVGVWEVALDELLARVAASLGGEQPRRQAEAYARGLLSSKERKNGWTLAEYIHDAGPQKTQRLLNEYSWNENGVRDVIRSYALEHLAEPDGVLALDETGFLKKGRRSAGVQRQY
ncbi:transposase, partial [Pseudofrankia asymbiotica]|uniref:transposase n=1 Tax=Pseudofrankia asymbiotica TaxID=1834516 RepID=UPI0018E9D457